MPAEPRHSAPPLLVVAVLAEALPLIRRMEQRQWHSPRLLEGRLAGRRVLLLRAGVGHRRAKRATACVIRTHSVGEVLSMGTCGALVDDLSVGDLVTAHSILDLPAERVSPMTGNARAVVLATVPRVVDDPLHRQTWAGRGAEVCEMEAAAVARAAGGHPFTTLKVVSDHAGARPPRIPNLPSRLRITAFQLRAYQLVEAHLAPALEGWLRASELDD